MSETGSHAPKVSVICLCFNQAPFVKQSLQSVIDQTYQNVEVIIINDASTDHSSIEIGSFLENHPDILFLDLTENIGNCKAFNLGLSKASGKYIIDLSCDDILVPDRIEKQVSAFEKLPEAYGVVYSDATYIDHQGNALGQHFDQYSPGKGDLYVDLVARYFIAPPTMMMQKVVLDDLGGYDEQLAYEDFDFWVRSARQWRYDYLDEPLTLIRKTSGSLSSQFFQRDSPLISSTVSVCKKIKTMNKTQKENQALVQRLRYELKIASATGSKQSAMELYDLLLSLEIPKWKSKFWLFFSSLRWNVIPLIRAFK